MRVLITGGTGFIGTHVVEELLRRGCQPAVYDLNLAQRRDVLPAEGPLYQGDIRDAARLAFVFDEFRPEAVCHLAAQVSVSRSVREPAFDADVNIVGLLQVLQQSARCGVKKFAFASSGGALYGDVTEPATEEDPCRPLSPYGISKRAGELYVESFAHLHGMKATALRFANVYGPRQDPHGEAGVVAVFTSRLLKGERITINGDGRYVRDYVAVEDVARATADALQADLTEPFTPLNIGTGRGTDVNQLADILLRLCAAERTRRGKDASLPPAEHGPPRPGDLRSSLLSAERAQQVLGWQPQVSLEEGLQKTVVWFAEPTQSGSPL